MAQMDAQMLEKYHNNTVVCMRCVYHECTNEAQTVRLLASPGDCTTSSLSLPQDVLRRKLLKNQMTFHKNNDKANVALKKVQVVVMCSLIELNKIVEWYTP